MGKRSSSLFKKRKTPKSSKSFTAYLAFIIVMLIIVFIVAKSFFYIALAISAITLAVAAWNSFKEGQSIVDIQVNTSN